MTIELKWLNPCAKMLQTQPLCVCCVTILVVQMCLDDLNFKISELVPPWDVAIFFTCVLGEKSEGGNFWVQIGYKIVDLYL